MKRVYRGWTYPHGWGTEPFWKFTAMAGETLNFDHAPPIFRLKRLAKETCDRPVRVKVIVEVEK